VEAAARRIGLTIAIAMCRIPTEPSLSTVGRPISRALDVTGTNAMLDDPPYYVNRKRCYGPSSDYAKNMAPGECAVAGDNPTEGGTSGLSVQYTSRDGSEEFRSVIDDLTIENKELRRRLRRLETLHCSHLEEDKLFEVKMHGLPLNKKRELEGILRGFAIDLKQSPDQPNCPPTSRESPAKAHSGDPSPASDARLQDSGYASLSASSRNLAATHLPRSHSKHSALARTKEQKGLAHAGSVRGRVHVRHTPLVLERAKMKPVVRRLEQLFTGRKATGEQSLRQQMAAQSVVRSGKELETLGEGVREACICLADTGTSIDPTAKSRDSSPPPPFRAGQPSSASAAQEQRPTHPLDLDLNRAQCPAENIDYIRHLGACSPKQNAGAIPQQDEGWVYLNVLTNMAQLHTINVTPEFVRKAITNLSDKLELSDDGRKIRWKGGNEGTNLTSDSGGISSEGRGTPDSPDEESSISGDGAKRQKLGNGLFEQRASGDSALRPEHVPALALKKRRKPHADLEHGTDTLRCPFEDDTFNYKPLFFHSGTYGKEGSYPGIGSSNPPCSPHAVYISTQNTQRDDRIQSLKRRREDGPIIFFNSADFCTDLSGDGTDFSSSYSSPLSAGRDACTQHDRAILGCPRPPAVRTASGSTDFIHPLTDTQPAGSEEALSDAGSDTALADNITALSNFRLSPQRTARDEQNVSLVELEASGVGGIQPSDNFAINVSFTVTGNTLPCSETLSSTPSSRVQKIVDRILETPATGLRVCDSRGPPETPREEYDPPVKCNVISATQVDLPPFQLPPPTYFFHPSSSSEDYSSDSADSGALAVNSSSQSSYNKQSSLTEVVANRRDKASSISFIRPWRMLDVGAVIDMRGNPKGSLRNENVGVGSLAATAEGSDGSGYESGDDDIS
jgi:Frequency clock protein